MDPAAKKLLDLKVEIIQAMAHPIRLAIIEFLSEGEQCVCDITEHIGAQRTNVSRHLGLMLKAGILECHKDGLKVIYSLKTPCIMNFISCVTNVLLEKMENHVNVLELLSHN
ncbi:MAG: hypothetical protein AMJ79_07470 [Phycisphaerae bacterium SM23_30]|nr:MAG: hypothetical protein AMJ79_07470 [Phycisphaerae bacterium SM23_30]